MILELGFPKGLIAVEKELDTLPYLQGGVLNKRRADIICFAKNIHPKHELYPLLMIECKAVKITKETLNQLKGYNHFVKALFISMANDEEIKTLWYNAKNKNYDMVDFLPSFHEMIKSIEKQ
ncbi:MAG: type I restriction enzyme HsdR N-terminal domain-containing protein [Chlamydiae bacterium]|nr:type I restriction enzyme HsdR N-terminal domain-containing protein [Chlamydiota bacterium]